MASAAAPAALGLRGPAPRGIRSYTPTVLGTAIFRRAALATPETLSVSLEMVGMFTWIHVLIFAALGGVASRLLAMVERKRRRRSSPRPSFA